MMNSARFNDFKEEADILIKSSAFFTNEVDRTIFENSHIIQNPDLYPEEELDKLEATLLHLEHRCKFEDTAAEQFRDKYRDLLK